MMAEAKRGEVKDEANNYKESKAISVEAKARQG
jgi:hypothetical protein